MPKEINLKQLIQAIQKLPSDKPQNFPGKWYRTQKEHWLGWLREYHGPGAYRRQVGKKRNAKFAYNRIVEYKMLLWLIKAAKINPRLVKAAQAASGRVNTMQEKSAAVRKHVSWKEVSAVLWELNEGGTQSNRVQNRAFSVRQPFAAEIMCGIKKIEYRTRSTSRRGRVYVYATKSPDLDWYADMGLQPGDLPVGVLVGTVEIIDCREKPDEYEWLLANPKRLKKPVKPHNHPQPVWFKPFKK